MAALYPTEAFSVESKAVYGQRLHRLQKIYTKVETLLANNHLPIGFPSWLFIHV